MKVLLPPKAADVSSPHGGCTDAANHDDHKDADGESKHSDHGHGVLDHQLHPRPQDAAAVVNHEAVGGLIRPLNTSDHKSAPVTILPLVRLGLERREPSLEPRILILLYLNCFRPKIEVLGFR